jgi:hypothetical protein
VANNSHELHKEWDDDPEINQQLEEEITFFFDRFEWRKERRIFFEHSR